MWTPRESDIKWCEDLLRITKNNAFWGCDAGVYRIEHSNKRLVRTVKGHNEEMHQMIVFAFKKVNYAVIEDESNGHGESKS